MHRHLIQSAEALRANSKASLLVIITVFYKINMNTEPFVPGEIQAQVQKSLKLRKHNNDNKNEKIWCVKWWDLGKVWIFFLRSRVSAI